MAVHDPQQLVCPLSELSSMCGPALGMVVFQGRSEAPRQTQLPWAPQAHACQHAQTTLAASHPGCAPGRKLSPA